MPTPESAMQEQPYRPKSHLLIFFCGIIMPVISITIEATTHWCAEEFFDPIPTVWHLLLVIFVPLAQLQGWFAIRRRSTDRLVLVGIANTIVIGISLFYSVVYLPLIPLAALMLLFGIGILPFTPMLSLLAALLMRYQLKRLAATVPQSSFVFRKSGLLAGLVLTAAVIAVIELPATLTRIGLQKAAAASPQTRSEGIRFLRTYGNKDALLRSCYNQTHWATDLMGSTFSLKSPVTPTEAQKIYYLVTGEAFDASIPPERVGGHLIPQDTFDFDSDQGGVKIGGKLKGLSLASSKLDASVDADGGVGYMEWTLVFQNQSDLQREARAEVQLPPGGVVSRLTLWVNDEEREAAFGGRGKVREAYHQVAIRQRRDPVLVTTAGRDRILVQCFPVQPRGEMKIRVGITVPLILEDLQQARLVLPHFVNRNFRIPDELNHWVWIDSKSPLLTWNKELLLLDLSVPGTFGLHGPIQDAALSQANTSVSMERSVVLQMWSKDPFDPAFVVWQKIEERTPKELRRIVVVVDTSESMQTSIPQVEAAIKSLPQDFNIKVVLAENYENTLVKSSLMDRPGEISGVLRAVTFAGGADNVPALLKAWDFAAEKPGNNAIVWIHGPQLLLFGSVDELRQRWERRPYGPTVYSVTTATGSDQIEKNLDGMSEVKSVTRTGTLQTDLENLFARLTGRLQTLELVRTSKKRDQQVDLSAAPETSDHLARLWANDEVARILAARNESLNDAATALAVRYQLVTPLSGAVVLETAAQYKAAGLKPVDAGTVPTIPEPEILALLLIASVFIAWLFYARRHKAG